MQSDLRTLAISIANQLQDLDEIIQSGSYTIEILEAYNSFCDYLDEINLSLKDEAVTETSGPIDVTWGKYKF